MLSTDYPANEPARWGRSFRRHPTRRHRRPLQSSQCPHGLQRRCLEVAIPRRRRIIHASSREPSPPTQASGRTAPPAGLRYNPRTQNPDSQSSPAKPSCHLPPTAIPATLHASPPPADALRSEDHCQSQRASLSRPGKAATSPLHPLHRSGRSRRLFKRCISLKVSGSSR